jgi:hypothetical protein
MAIELRPTFAVDLPETSDVVAERLHVGLADRPVWTRWARVPGARAEAPSGHHFVWIAVPESQQRLFSPWLQLSIFTHAQGSHLFGRFSPKPTVWTVFALSYLFLSCVAFFSLIGGIGQWMIERSPWMWWITLGALALLVTLYVISMTGQRLACRQMLAIRQAIDECLGTSLVDGTRCR